MATAPRATSTRGTAPNAVICCHQPANRSSARRLGVIAHEYGHHVQALTGILAASHARETSIKGVDAPLQERRRRELQASCLSGVYQGADRTWFPVRGSWLQQWQFTVRNRGDEWNPQRDHGSKKNHGRWSLRGFGSADPGSCNTFTAAPSAVS